MVAPPDVRPPVVLIIEDDQDTLDAYRTWLGFEGIPIVTATDGFDGLEKAFALQPDLILLDLHLPGIDGWDLAARLKAHPLTKATPLVAVTADVTAQAQERARQVGIDEFREKPYALPDLVEMIRRHLDASPT